MEQAKALSTLASDGLSAPPGPGTAPPPHLPSGLWGCVLGCRVQPTGGERGREWLPPLLRLRVGGGHASLLGSRGHCSVSPRLAARGPGTALPCAWRRHDAIEGHQMW